METHRHPDNPIIVGFQGKAQLEVIYGHLAEVMLSQPATSIYLKTKEPNAREWVSTAIGKVEIESLKETHFNGSRSRRNFALDCLQSIGLPSHGRCYQGGEHRLAQPRDRRENSMVGGWNANSLSSRSRRSSRDRTSPFPRTRPGARLAFEWILYRGNRRPPHAAQQQSQGEWRPLRAGNGRDCPGRI
jgi:hypothetical protein